MEFKKQAVNTYLTLKTKTKMILRVLFLLMALSAHLSIFAQNTTPRLSVEFSYGMNSYSMDQLNEHYIDGFAAQDDLKLLDDRIESGQHFRLGINYQPSALFDLGCYGSYQYGNAKSRPVISETDEMGGIMNEHEGNAELRTEALGVGVNATFYLSSLLKLQEKENGLNRLHFGLELNGGIGFSRASIDIYYQTFPYGLDYLFSTSQDFQGMLALKAEYDLTRSPIFTSLGLRIGYQYFETNTLKNRLGNEWIVDGEHPIDLNFSGLHVGGYIKFAR